MLALRRLTTFRWPGPGVFGAGSEKKQWLMSGVPALQHPDDLALAVQAAVPDGGGVIGPALDEAGRR